VDLVDRVEGAYCGLRPAASLSPFRPFAHAPFRLPPAAPFELNIQGYLLLLDSAL